MRHPNLNAPPPGLVLWSGPSRLDGGPVSAIVTLRSMNEKTGPMLQTWIIRSDTDPVAAVRAGNDVSVCGACPLRGALGKGRGCYVNLQSGGPGSVYRTLRAGRYPEATDRLLSLYATGRPVRLGSYGDPAAVPIVAWSWLLGYCPGWTGYTHQWRDPANFDYRTLLMASVESEEQRDEAKGLGWRTYRILRPGEATGHREFICPASPEGGRRELCYTCRACNGTANHPGAADVAIRLHGSPPVVHAALSVLNG